MRKFLLVLLLLPLIAFAHQYPEHWFSPVPRNEAYSWEILPQDAAPGEVILSKRHELGLFSNFAATPFQLDGESFASVEGLWQSLKYPDPKVPNDSRHKIKDWKFTRYEVQMMTASDAKHAGNEANDLYEKYDLINVNWKNHFFDYVDFAEGSDFHLKLITRALRAKLDQNPELWELLLSTGDLVLKPDHKMGGKFPASFEYYKIFMKLRSERQFIPVKN